MTTTQCILTHHNDPDRPRRPVDGLQVCAGHRHRTRRHLAQLGPLHALLGERAAPTGSRRIGPRSTELRIPYNPQAATIRTAIRTKLAWWVRTVTTERGLADPQLVPQPRTRPAQPTDMRRVLNDRSQRAYTAWETRGALGWPRLARPPRQPKPDTLTPHATTHQPPDRATLIVDWLTPHHDWLLAQPYTDDYTQDLDDLHSTAWAVAYPTGRRRVPICQCPKACGGWLTALIADTTDMLPDALLCDTCEHALAPRQWITLGRNLTRADTMLTAVQLSAVLGVPVPTLQSWAHRDTWARDQGRPTRYRAEDAQTSYDRRHPQTQETPA